MIQPLRATHRRTFAVLSVLIPVIIAVGVASRHPESSVPGRVVVSMGGRSTRGLIVAQRTGSEVVVIAQRQLEFPDLLVYWSSSPSASSPDSQSVFLGNFSPGRLNQFVLPAGSETGSLILYSMPLGRVIDTAAIGGTP